MSAPLYTVHGSNEDVVNILVCQIKIWRPQRPNWTVIPENTACTYITEVDNITINKSYDDLVSTATVRLPLGSVFEHLLQQSHDEVVTGNQSDQTVETDLLTATQQGDTLVRGAALNKRGEPTYRLNYKSADPGLVQFENHREEVDLSVGQRIQIKLAYVHDSYDATGRLVSGDEKWQKVKDYQDVEELWTAFTGFISGISVSSPVEIECEDMASLLKKITIPKMNSKVSMDSNTFFKPDGALDLLKGTGLKLDDINIKNPIEVGRLNFENSVSVADMLYQWKRSGICARMVGPEGVTLRLGLVPQASGEVVNSGDKKRIDYNASKAVEILQFDWDVANDDIKVTHGNKVYLQVNAKGKDADGREMSMLVRWDENAKKFYPAAKKKYEKKARKTAKKGKKVWNPETFAYETVKAGSNETGKTYQGAKMTGKGEGYTTIPCFVDGVCTEDRLMEAAKTRWKNYSMNGCSGSLTIFGDKKIEPCQTVALICPLYPEKDGYYFVESVTTTFGSDGYRQELKLPYKISDFGSSVKITWI